MFNIGDVIIYSSHGLCQIDDICEKTYGDTTGTYYVLHPLENARLIINIPIDSEKIVMQNVLNKEEAKEILHSFQQPGIEWIENARERTKKYKSLVNSGDRNVIAQVAVTLMEKKRESTKEEKKLDGDDRALLANIEKTMYKELAVSLDTSYEEISKKVKHLVSQ